MGRIMGIDYGAKNVGIALSDDAKTFAFAKDIYKNDEYLLEKISNLAEKENVESFVVGESDNPAGGVNTIMRRIIIFSEALKLQTELPVFQMEESYSSAEARRFFETKIKNRKNKKIPVDAAAAAIILQKYLDSKKQNNN